jgi:hypothetical protein
MPAATPVWTTLGSAVKATTGRFAPRAAELVRPNRKCNSRQQAPIAGTGSQSRRLVAGSDWNARPRYCSLAISRNTHHSDREIFPFARPNVQIYDAHVVDLYQWVCARYLVGVKGADTKAKRDLNSALDRISEQITTDLQPRGVRGSRLEKQNSLARSMELSGRRQIGDG